MDRKNLKLAARLLGAVVFCTAAQAQTPASQYDHERFAPEPVDIRRQSEAFVVSFDSKDDDDGDGKADLRRIPEWVAQEIRRFEGECINTRRRPSRWTTDRELYASGVAPNDASYSGSGFDRGHMAAKLLAARISLDADRKTHTVLNAVPQFRRFNQQIWRDLENHTGAWAQSYGRIWVIQGPVFYSDTKPENARWIGDEVKGERLVAVPDALFKIVVRDAEPPGAVESLAFLYPQLGPRYYAQRTEFEHERFLTTIAEIENLTGLDFPSLNSQRTRRAEGLWPTRQEEFLTGCVGSE